MSCKYSQDTNIEVEFQLEKAVKIHYVDVGKTVHFMTFFIKNGFFYIGFFGPLLVEIL